MKRYTPVLCILLFAVILLSPQNGSSCGPFLDSPLFTNYVHPALPMEVYVRGNLGILSPGYARSYLVLAYRYLTGRPLSEREVRQALEYYRYNFKSPWTPGAKDPAEEWMKARAAVMGEADRATAPETYREVSNGYERYGNCLAGSFENAVFTLRDRIRRFGAADREVREWVRGQDTVFSNCEQGRKIPPPASAGSSPWFKDDRRYQIAAATFYSGDFGIAAQQFDEIARDSASSWRDLAPYLAARAMIRRGTVAQLDEPAIDRAALSDAERRLKAIIADPGMRKFHKPARNLLRFVELRLDPAKLVLELAAGLSGAKPGADFFHDLIDYTRGLDRLMPELPDPMEGPSPGTPEYEKNVRDWYRYESDELKGLRRRNEMTDWIVTFQHPGETSRAHAISVWRKRGDVLWLVAAISQVKAEDPVVPELMAAAAAVPAGSPAFAMLGFHRARLLIDRDERAAARAVIDEVLGQAEIDPSSRNYLLSQRSPVAKSLEEFLRLAPRPVIEVISDNIGEMPQCDGRRTCDRLLFRQAGKAGKPSEYRFDEDAVRILNLGLPLDLMARAASGTEIPMPLRNEVAAAVWTRAVMLGRHDIASSLTPILRHAYPVIDKDLEDYMAAQSPEEKHRAALFLVLRSPGLRPFVNSGAERTTAINRIDNYRDNWWCGDLGGNLEGAYYLAETDKDNTEKNRKLARGLLYLSSGENEAVENEWRLLRQSGTAPNYLAWETLKWAHERPDDPRVPEALHLAVRSTRYGCDGIGTSALSRKAFTLLHSRYRGSRWAKETPYWF